MDFAEFQLPFGLVRCRISLIAELTEEAESGYRRMPWGGAEFGGLLLGRRESACMMITGRQEIYCDHEYGPAFQLSTNDCLRLEQELDALQKISSPEVVGWYYTTSRDLVLNAEATKTADRYFSQPQQLTVIISRDRTAPPRFGIVCRDEGEVWRPCAEFTLSDLDPRAEPPPEPISQPVEGTVSAPSLAGAENESAPVEAPSQTVGVTAEGQDENVSFLESTPNPAFYSASSDSPVSGLQSHLTGAGGARAVTGRQLLAGFFTVIILLGVFFSMGYIIGRNAAHVNANPNLVAKPPTVEPPPVKTQESAPAPLPPTETSPQQPTSTAAHSEPEPEGAKPVGLRPTKTEQARSAAASRPVAGLNYLQLATTSRHEADIMMDVLQKKGFRAIAAEIGEEPGTFRVLVGPVTDATINRIRGDLQGAGFPGNAAIRRMF